MPHFLQHKRRHSWPYCGPVTHRRNLLALRAPQPEIPYPQQQFLTPVVSDGGFDVDDAASAGIVRSKITRSHRIWSSSRDATAGASESNGSSSTASLRRMIRPPLDKARSLFVLPTTTTTGQNVVISYWAPPAPVPLVAVQPLSAVEMTRRRIVREESGSLSVERKHRRCHSEQPRAWRKPSASLWPLEEE